MRERDEALTHIRRTQLPWRNDDGLTECGRDASIYPSLSRDESLVKFKKLGQQRFALVTCMTCMDRADMRYRVEHDRGIIPVLAREIQRVQWKEKEERQRLIDEFDAIMALIDVHREQFDGYLAAKAQTTDLDLAREKKNAAAKWNSGS